MAGTANSAMWGSRHTDDKNIEQCILVGGDVDVSIFYRTDIVNVVAESHSGTYIADIVPADGGEPIYTITVVDGKVWFTDLLGKGGEIISCHDRGTSNIRVYSDGTNIVEVAIAP